MGGGRDEGRGGRRGGYNYNHTRIFSGRPHEMTLLDSSWPHCRTGKGREKKREREVTKDTRRPALSKTIHTYMYI